ncbi:hypothetical protein GF377_00120 [candidate division GN15 bacterium]|nr:hypothetical protein [candidate division GN15 bacterium]
MPCTDVTELLSITLDTTDRVTLYALHKETCGGAVAGRGLIRDHVKDKTVAEILTLQPGDVVAESDRGGSVNEYLLVKHLLAVQSALAAYEGREADTDTGLLQIEAIEYGPERTVIQARIQLDVLTDKIKACGLCGDSCGHSE